MSAVREAYDEIHALDTEVFGINPDDADSHRRFKEKLKLPYDLLVDEGLAVATAYDALKPDPRDPTKRLSSIKRTVVIVGKDGTIIYRAPGSPPSTELIDVLANADDAGDDS